MLPFKLEGFYLSLEPLHSSSGCSSPTRLTIARICSPILGGWYLTEPGVRDSFNGLPTISIVPAVGCSCLMNIFLEMSRGSFATCSRFWIEPQGILFSWHLFCQ